MAAVASAAAEITHLEALGELSVPSTPVRGVQVGGLSGLTWDPVGRRYWAISDDRAERGAVRVYRLRIDVADGVLSEVEVEDFIELRLADGAGFGAGRVDPEGVAWMRDGSFLVSSEGVVRWEVPPFLRIFGADGVERSALPLPARYAARRDRQSGVRDNLGLESAAVSPDGRWGFSAVESSLIQDAPPPSSGNPSPTRILRFDLDRRRLDAEFVYLVDPLQRAPATARLNVSGVVELLSLDSESLLVLERAFATGVGTRVRLYEASLAAADDVKEIAALAGRLDGLRAAEKSLVFDVAELGTVPDNLEAMTFGPDLPDGRRLLLLLADDNFAVPLQHSQLLAYAVDRRPLTIHDIQGCGHRSPLEGHWVRGVQGVVTAVAEAAGGRTGFWMETPSGARDENGCTSEGIFVVPAGDTDVAVGDLVRVQGAVREDGTSPGLTRTLLTGGSVTPVGTDAALSPGAGPEPGPFPLGGRPTPSPSSPSATRTPGGTSNRSTAVRASPARYASAQRTCGW